MMIDKRPFMKLADELSSTKCPDCGGTHDVTFSFVKDAVTYPTFQDCPGFNDLVVRRFKRLYSLEIKKRFLLP